MRHEPIFASDQCICSSSKKTGSKSPDALIDLKGALQELEDDAFNPALKTHKLSGSLSDSWACSAGYKLRIIFSIVKHEGKEAILLETVGTHDEVY